MVVSTGRRVSIELCGDVRLEVDGRRRERELPGRLGRVLLGYLALNRHRAVSRDELIDALWPNGAPDDPGGTLSTLLSGVRRCLGAESVRGRNELRLVLAEGAQLDVDQAAEDLERGRAALEAGEPKQAAADAQAAVDVLERGLLLQGFEAPWLDERRLELDEARLGALELLARAGLAAGEAWLSRSHAASRRIVALAPYREAGYALLMEAQAAQGNLAEALRTFDGLRRLLREELGAAPSAELRAAHRRLLERTEEPGSAPAPPLPAALARLAGARLVGRDDALALLRDHLAAAADGRRFVLLAGEPGIGKTTLASVFAREAHERGGVVVLFGRSDEDALAPYQPFAEMIEHCLAHGALDEFAGELRFELEELGRIVPRARRWPPTLREPPTGLPDVERYRLFEAVVAVLSRLARRSTLVLVCDDLHWADPPTLQLLRHLARASTPDRLLVVGAYRDVEVAPDSPLGDLIADLRRERLFERITLAGLHRHETDRLIEARGLPGGAARRLHELTGGNPLFLEEMLRTLAEAGDAERALAQLVVPEGVAEVVLRRVSRLGEPAHEVLTLAAVAGQAFKAAALERAAEASPDAVVDVLDRALAARLLTPGDDPELLSFAHALIRDALYGGLSDTKRVRLHRRVAETLEAHRAELRPDVAELAHHFFQARHVAGPEPAIRYAREAADRAAQSLAWEDEARHLERALEAERMREPPDRSDRTELLLGLGEALTRAGRATARSVFAEAAALARGRAPEQLARAAIGHGGRYYEAGVIDRRLIALLREALAALPPRERDLRSRLIARLAEILHFAGEPEPAIRLSEEAVALAGQLGDDQVLWAALAGRHVALLHVEHLDERLDVGGRLLELARRGGDSEREMQALQARVFDLLMLGDLEGGRRELERLDALARELHQPLFEHFVMGWSCTLAQSDGRLDDAERLAGMSYELRRKLETQDAESVYAAQLFMIRRAQGRVHEMLPAVAEAVERFPALAAWRAALPLVQLAAGDEARAREELDRLVDGLAEVPRDFFWLTAMWLLAEAAAALRAADPAERLYAVLAPYASRFIQIGYAAGDGPVARPLGLLAAARGDRPAAIAHLADALRLCRTAGAPAFETRARADLADVLAGGDPDERTHARELATEALAQARRLGMPAVVERTERQLAALEAAAAPTPHPGRPA